MHAVLAKKSTAGRINSGLYFTNDESLEEASFNLYKSLTAAAKARQGLRVLVFDCNEWVLAAELAALGCDVLALVPAASEMPDIGGVIWKDIDYENGKIDAPDEMFDCAVFCDIAFELFKHEELRRVVRPKGRLIVTGIRALSVLQQDERKKHKTIDRLLPINDLEMAMTCGFRLSSRFVDFDSTHRFYGELENEAQALASELEDPGLKKEAKSYRLLSELARDKRICRVTLTAV